MVWICLDRHFKKLHFNFRIYLFFIW